jgi:hypothetical protein
MNINEALNTSKLNRIQKQLEIKLRQLKSGSNTDSAELNKTLLTIEALQAIAADPSLVDGKVSGINNKFLNMLRQEQLKLRTEILKGDPNLDIVLSSYMRIKSLLRLTTDKSLYNTRVNENNSFNITTIDINEGKKLDNLVSVLKKNPAINKVLGSLSKNLDKKEFKKIPRPLVDLQKAYLGRTSTSHRVKPYYFHLSPVNDPFDKAWTQIPKAFKPYEDQTVPRFSYSHNLDGAAWSVPKTDSDEIKELSIHVPRNHNNVIRTIQNKNLLKDKAVYGGNWSEEGWGLDGWETMVIGKVKVNNKGQVVDRIFFDKPSVIGDYTPEEKEKWGEDGSKFNYKKHYKKEKPVADYKGIEDAKDLEAFFKLADIKQKEIEAEDYDKEEPDINDLLAIAKERKLEASKAKNLNNPINNPIDNNNLANNSSFANNLSNSNNMPRINENNNRVNITKPAWPISAFAQDLKAMYGEFLEPGEEDKEAYEEASQYLLESNKKYEAEQVVKAYSSGGWRKALSVIADLGIAGTAGVYGLAMFGLATWGGPITAGAIGLGLLTALMIGTYGEVIKALLLGADNLLRRNPKMEKLFNLAKKDAKATEIVESIKKEMDKEKPVKDTLKVLKKDLEKRLKELEKEQVSFKEDADMKYVLEGNLFDNIRAKRERIAKGSGEKVAKPGDEDYPKDLKKIAKEAALNEALATPKKGESKDDFISRFMGSELAMKEFPDHKQRVAVAFSQLKKTKNLNEELFKAEFAIEIDGQKTGVVDAESKDDAISKIIEKFNIDVENIEDLKKVEPELNEGWKTKLGLAALGAAAMTGGFKNTPNIEPIQGYASKIVDKADDVGKTFVKSANIIGNKAKDVARGSLDYAENIGSKFTQKVDDMMNQVDNADKTPHNVPINETKKNAPFKGSNGSWYIRTDGGYVEKLDDDHFDDEPKQVKPVDPSDNPDLYEEDPDGQLRFKLKESSNLLTKYGVEGYNKPKRTPSHKTKSHLVVAKKGDKIKVVRFGAQGVSGSPKKDGESESYRKRRQGFVARHKAQNPGGMKDKFSALYWANKVKW